VINVLLLPYAVPTELVAYARTKYAVDGVRPEIWLVKVPVPPPEFVKVPDMVGLGNVP
jgi:hypothetical protein